MEIDTEIEILRDKIVELEKRLERLERFIINEEDRRNIIVDNRKKKYR